MAISYSTPAFSYVDSQFGTAATATGIKVNVPIITDLKYHRRVQAKNFWKKRGLIGEDAYSEGNEEGTAPGYPVIRKTEFNAKRGDTIIMHQRTNLSFAGTTGKVGGFQLVDAEVGWDLNYKKVKIEQWRQGVLTGAGMNVQRNPFQESFTETEMDLLSNWSAQVEDNGLTAALHYGHAYHLLRQYGTTNLPLIEFPNVVVGNDETLAQTAISALRGDGADNPSGKTIRLGYLYCTQNYFDPVIVEGDAYFICLASPQFINFLFQDLEFRQAMQYARERGITNPLFKSDTILYHNVLIIPYDKIRSQIGGYDPTGLSVSNGGAATSSYTETAYTGIGSGLSSTQIHQTFFLGANALGLAEGPMRMAERAENDYGQLIGRAADNIWGAQRLDWNDATGTFSNFQGGVKFINSIVTPAT